MELLKKNSLGQENIERDVIGIRSIRFSKKIYNLWIIPISMNVFLFWWLGKNKGIKFAGFRILFFCFALFSSFPKQNGLRSEIQRELDSRKIQLTRKETYFRVWDILAKRQIFFFRNDFSHESFFKQNLHIFFVFDNIVWLNILNCFTFDSKFISFKGFQKNNPNLQGESSIKMIEWMEKLSFPS